MHCLCQNLFATKLIEFKRSNLALTFRIAVVFFHSCSSRNKSNKVSAVPILISLALLTSFHINKKVSAEIELSSSEFFF